MPIDIRSVLAVELAFALATLFTGTPPADDIRLPNPPAVPQPMPPAPPPAASTLTVNRDTLYVFDADVPVLVLTSPAGLVTVTEEKGPVRVRGRFADGAGKVETRTFAGKSVFSVEPSTSGRVEILVVPVGAVSADKVVRRTVDVDAGEAPRPPPILPDGKLGLIKVSRDGAAKVANSPGKAAESAKLAKAQREHVAAVVAGKFLTPAAILEGWRAANNGAVAAATWKPWGDAVTASLSALYADGKLKANADWAAAFDEIAKGLEATP